MERSNPEGFSLRYLHKRSGNIHPRHRKARHERLFVKGTTEG